jgi:hypothetical protein
MDDQNTFYAAQNRLLHSQQYSIIEDAQCNLLLLKVDSHLKSSGFEGSILRPTTPLYNTQEPIFESRYRILTDILHAYTVVAETSMPALTDHLLDLQTSLFVAQEKKRSYEQQIFSIVANVKNISEAHVVAAYKKIFGTNCYDLFRYATHPVRQLNIDSDKVLFSIKHTGGKHAAIISDLQLAMLPLIHADAGKTVGLLKNVYNAA